MNFEIYIKEILESIRDISKDLKDIRNENAMQNLTIQKLEASHVRNSENIDRLKEIIDKHAKYINENKKAANEISGFVKYSKYLWIALSALITYAVQHITWNW